MHNARCCVLQRITHTHTHTHIYTKKYDRHTHDAHDDQQKESACVFVCVCLSLNSAEGRLPLRFWCVCVCVCIAHLSGSAGVSSLSSQGSSHTATKCCSNGSPFPCTPVTDSNVWSNVSLATTLGLRKALNSQYLVQGDTHTHTHTNTQICHDISHYHLTAGDLHVLCKALSQACVHAL